MMRGKSVFRLMGTVVLTMLLFTGMSGCSEKESGPGSIMDIDGISVPAQFRGYYGDEVTVGGSGFDESDIIAMQSSASSSEEYTAQVVRVTDNSVSFLIPEGLTVGCGLS